MAIYFSSDWHVGHSNVLKFDQRPFKDLHHMHRVLINNYNATVHPGDTCYFLGDMGLCSQEVLKGVISQLNGTKILIRGNHDAGPVAMKKAGFDVVLNMAAITVGKTLVTMTHCPLRGVFREDVSGMRGGSVGENWHGENRHRNFSIPDFGQFHAHGHIHAGPHNNKPVIDGRQWDVGVPGNNYRPVSLSQIESWIANYKKEHSNG